MSDSDLEQLRVFDPDAKKDPDEEFPDDPTVETSEFPDAEKYGGSNWRSQGYYGNPNDADNQATTAKTDQSVPSGHVGIPSAGDDPMADPHPVGRRSDAEIQADIDAYLKQHTEADLTKVKVTVRHGVATVSGQADSRAQEIVEMQVRGVAGVTDFKNEIGSAVAPPTKGKNKR